ncbi:MAG TPA: magnesium transporter [Syntrophomonadaceae bacterium]|nr:magnesium transporter [Syntrophomonadaceae bacterium]
MNGNVAKNLKYKKESAGAIYKSNYLVIFTTQVVNEAIRLIRQQGKDMRGIHYLYVADEDQRLTGVLSLRELITADVDQNVADIMKSEVISVPVDMDQEEVAKVMQDYDVVALPVVNEIGEMVGIIHAEDVIDVMQAEATEDFHKMATVADLSVNVKDAGIFSMFSKRIGWLIILVFMNIFSGAGIAFFEETIAASIALVFFLPLLIDSGGNAGSQSATLMIRSMAVGDVKPKDWSYLFAKEIGVAVLLGATMALAVSGIGFFRGGMDIAVIVSATMLLIVIVGSLIGMSLPFLFSKINVDPATASGPLVTSFADITGVLIYFSIATWYLAL